MVLRQLGTMRQNEVRGSGKGGTNLTDSRAKVLPIVLVLDQEAEEHAWVETRQRHLAHFVAVVRPQRRIGVRIEEEVSQSICGVGRSLRGRRSGRRGDHGDERVGDDEVGGDAAGRSEDAGEGESLGGGKEVGGRVTERDRRTRVVRIDVEEGIGLCADKVVRRRRPAACDTDRLGELKDGLRPRRRQPPASYARSPKRTLIAS